MNRLFGKLTELEVDFELFDRRIQGVRFWQLIRVEIFRRITQLALNESKTKGAWISTRDKLKSFLSSFSLGVSIKEQKFLSNLIKFILLAFSFKRNPLFTLRKDILFFGSPRRVLRPDGFWWDIYTDFIIDELTLSSVTIEGPIGFEHRSPAKTKGLGYLNLLNILELVPDNMGSNKVNLTDDEKAFLQTLEIEIQDRFAFNVELTSRVLTALRKRKIRRPFYKLLLKRIQPKVVVIVFGRDKVDFIRVAQEMGIPVVELQHGTIGPHDVGVSYPKQFHGRVTFPDFFFTFGDHWNHSAQFPIEQDRIVSGGFPFLECEFEKYRHIPKRKQILFISQWIIGKEISQFAVDVSKLPELDYDIVFKLHPMDCIDWRDRYPELDSADIRVIDESTPSLYKLFAESQVLVGVYSTAVVEGLMFGLDTYVIDAFGIEKIQHFIDAGAMKKVADVYDLVDNLSDSHLSHDFRSDTYFRPNATKRIACYLKQLAERNNLSE